MDGLAARLQRPGRSKAAGRNIIIQAVAAIEDQNNAQVAAVRRIDMLAYPLTLVGMIVSVLALGHLLMSLPKRLEQQTPRPEIMRTAVISVILVGLLSLLDLVWSLLAWQAGQTRELNPLASGLIQDPQSLIAFKSLTILASCVTLVAVCWRAALTVRPGGRSA